MLSSCGIRIMKYEFEDDHVVAEKVTSVKVRGEDGAGNVSIRYQQGLTETKIHRKVEHARDNRPSGIAHRVEGSTLVLDGCGRDCEINYDVVIPSADISVIGDTGSGDVTVEGLASVDFSTGSGRITARDISGDVKAKAGSGDFTATRVSGAVTADLGSGRIQLVADHQRLHFGEVHSRVPQERQRFLQPFENIVISEIDNPKNGVGVPDHLRHPRFSELAGNRWQINQL